MIGALKMSSGVWAAAAPYACGAALASTVACGLASGWLAETTPTTIAARATLIWIAVMWPLLPVWDPKGRPLLLVAGAVVIGGMTAAISVFGIMPVAGVGLVAVCLITFSGLLVSVANA